MDPFPKHIMEILESLKPNEIGFFVRAIERAFAELNPDDGELLIKAAYFLKSETSQTK